MLSVIQDQLLQSLVYQKQSQSDEAQATLTRAIALAEPGGFIRPFLDLGPEMAGLLVQFSQRGVAPEYITRILAAFPGEMKDETLLQVADSTDSSMAARTQAQNLSSSLVEPLTPRELDVLRLIAQGLTNKEIAQRLVISHGTVRQHAYNLFQKLQVRRVVVRDENFFIFQGDGSQPPRRYIPRLFELCGEMKGAAPA